MPKPAGPWKDSPESFSRMRWYTGLDFLEGSSLPFLADLDLMIFFVAVVAAIALRMTIRKRPEIVTNNESLRLWLRAESRLSVAQVCNQHFNSSVRFILPCDTSFYGAPPWSPKSSALLSGCLLV